MQGVTLADALESAFEIWLHTERPSGDVSETYDKWLNSSDYTNVIEEYNHSLLMENEMANPTPGPWLAENIEEQVGGITHKYIWKITGAEGVVNTVARLGFVDAGSAVIAANARLISKAPDLYLALSALVNFHDGIPLNNDAKKLRRDFEELMEYARKVLSEAVS